MNVDRFFSVFKTSGQGMAAMRKQLQVSAENIANAYTTKVEGTDAAYNPKSMVTNQSDGAKFRIAMQKSQLELRNTRSEHLDKGSAISLGGGVMDSMAPDVEITSEASYRYEYDPRHPDADENGMVQYPDLDMVEEMTNMITANRLFEANMSVVEAEKQIIKRSLEI